MTKRMLIDSTHAEETRVVVLENNRLEDFDVETSTKKQLKGNIYLAKIVRVEPSLQAAFVEFGGGRHGFLAFGEIHPDYYQIPVADRRRLMEMQEAEAREDEEEEERQAVRAAQAPERPERSSERGSERGGDRRRRGRRPQGSDASSDASPAEETEAVAEEPGDEPAAAAPHELSADALTEAAYATQADPEAAEIALPRPDQVAQPAAIAQEIIVAPEEAQAMFPEPGEAADEAAPGAAPGAALGAAPEALSEALAEALAEPAHDGEPEHTAEPAADPGQEDTSAIEAPPAPEDVGGSHDDEAEREERSERRGPPRFLRNYKIQEVIRRRQILLVQVVKEERGTKGAALTTYISLAGRFSVLMPNSPRGGGISRKITSAADRRRLKEVTAELDLPRGMGLIVRTAGANRPKPEILRDGEYLLNQWDQIRELTMKSMAPALIYEEASLIKRAIRDVYSRDVDDILVDGEEGWRAAHDFMRMLMPTHAKKVQLWKEPQPLFAKAQVESQLDAMLLPNVQLRSGGYLVINQTEALVAIDVNSGRSTRERGIEETALRTNLEAAEEAARQLRLRDLAGLIVIDFIDMESRRNNAAVEKRLKDSLRHDRARIQVGSISHFGLLEMSRQRLRPSLTETTFVACPHCGGSGHVRGTESAALHVLRGIEEEGAKRRAAEIVVHVAGSIAFYILNHKRVRLGEVEERFGLVVTFQPDDSLRAPEMRIELVRAQSATPAPAPVSQLAPPEPFEDPDEETEAAAEDEDAAPEPAAETGEDAEARGRKRRRRRRGRRDDEAAGTPEPASGEAPVAEPGEDAPTPMEAIAAEDEDASEAETAAPQPGEEGAPQPGDEGERKRRGRRGGRRRRRSSEDGTAPATDGTEPVDESPPATPPAYTPPAYTAPAYAGPTYSGPTYTGPTPADPFGGSNDFAFFDAVERAAEEERTMSPTTTTASVPLPTRAMDPVPAAPEPTPEPAPEPGPEPAPEPAPEPVLETAAATPAPEPPPVTVGPATLPITIGTEDAAPAEKKRGWWRR